MSEENLIYETVRIAVEAGEENLRIDRLLVQRYPECSRHYFQGLIFNGLVLINNQPCMKRYRVSEGDEVEIRFIITPDVRLVPEDIPLDVLYEDEHIIVVNKPANMTVHPGPGNWRGTFANALAFHCKELEGDFKTLRPGIVHRLDRYTSGVLLAAKTRNAQHQMQDQFASRKVQKEYLAVCLGTPGDGEIINRIGRHPVHRKKQTVLENQGREAITHFQTLASNGKLSLVRVKPTTGRTHQIRVHMQYHGTPILGDQIYGSAHANQNYGIHRQLLHAHKLSFFHPHTKEALEVTAPLPEDMITLLRRIPFSPEELCD